ncbi:hypothetical protein GC425_03965 [Corynebacterium sp. zg254]|uniref:CAP domain-containing protein n=1 Tax=Corynebacterium zhongnanshanii TaxID=2768834 RepID=A0ABQ6VEP6_9CORY|nr:MULTISPECIES: CAP domain-containing protein [Corynebacterium]KAB3522900.1 CAP domain-containing protein [Corynebacterium zhongnanshanii]MCR5914026.1 hypothetical protein [Corynebacterium sp. zg254]
MANPLGGISTIVLSLLGSLAPNLPIPSIDLGSLSPEVAQHATHNVSQEAPSHQITQAELINALNDYRRQHNLRPLQADAHLNNVAQDWSQRMAHEGKLHHRPNFMASYAPGARTGAENCLMSYAGASAQDLIKAWHNSPGHRANMQNPEMTHVGVGVAYAANGTVWATQNFAAY